MRAGGEGKDGQKAILRLQHLSWDPKGEAVLAKPFMHVCARACAWRGNWKNTPCSKMPCSRSVWMEGRGGREGNVGRGSGVKFKFSLYLSQGHNGHFPKDPSDCCVEKGNENNIGQPPLSLDFRIQNFSYNFFSFITHLVTKPGLNGHEATYALYSLSVNILIFLPQKKIICCGYGELP